MKSVNKAQTVIITGANGGIGSNLARGFLERGDNVVLTGRNLETLNEVAAQLGEPERVAVVSGDIGSKSTGQALVKTALERFGSVDVLVNNAGVFYTKPFLENTEEDLETFFHTNLKGTYLTSQAAVTQMIEQGAGGAIINIGTVLVDHGITGVPVSSAMTSKGGIHALTVSLSSELASHNIRVNTVAPGIIRTPIHGDNDVDSLASLHPLNRVGEAGEVTEAVIHLANASYTTGVILAVDGGYRVGRQ